jgi:hypothetical protein
MCGHFVKWRTEKEMGKPTPNQCQMNSRSWRDDHRHLRCKAESGSMAKCMKR